MRIYGLSEARANIPLNGTAAVQSHRRLHSSEQLKDRSHRVRGYVTSILLYLSAIDASRRC